jgi:hypothetical protein
MMVFPERWQFHFVEAAGERHSSAKEWRIFSAVLAALTTLLATLLATALVLIFVVLRALLAALLSALALLLRILLASLLLVLLAGLALIAILVVGHWHFLPGMDFPRRFNPFWPYCVPQIYGHRRRLLVTHVY